MVKAKKSLKQNYFIYELANLHLHYEHKCLLLQNKTEFVNCLFLWEKTPKVLNHITQKLDLKNILKDQIILKFQCVIVQIYPEFGNVFHLFLLIFRIGVVAEVLRKILFPLLLVLPKLLEK